MTKYIVAFFLGLLLPLLPFGAHTEEQGDSSQVLIYQTTDNLTGQQIDHAWFLTKEKDDDEKDILVVRIRKPSGELFSKEVISLYGKKVSFLSSPISIRIGFVTPPDSLVGGESSFGYFALSQGGETTQTFPFFFETKKMQLPDRNAYLVQQMKFFLPDGKMSLVLRTFSPGSYNFPFNEEEFIYGADGKLEKNTTMKLLR